MEHAGDQLLAGTALTLDHHRTVAVGDLLHELQHLLHRLADADQLLQPILIPDGLPQQVVFLPQPVKLRRLSHHHRDGLEIKGFGNELKGPGLHGPHRGFDRPEPGHHDGNDFGILLGQPVDDLQPVDIGQLQVRHHDMDDRLSRGLNRRVAVLGHGHAVAFLQQQLLQNRPDGRIVLDNQYVDRVHTHNIWNPKCVAGLE